jgi:hypothetical protein
MFSDLKFTKLAFLIMLLSTFTFTTGCGDSTDDTATTNSSDDTSNTDDSTNDGTENTTTQQGEITQIAQAVQLDGGDVLENKKGEAATVKFDLGGTRLQQGYVSPIPDHYKTTLKVKLANGYEAVTITGFTDGTVVHNSLSDITSFIASLSLTYGYEYELLIEAFDSSNTLVAKTPTLYFQVGETSEFTINLVTVEAKVLAPVITGMTWETHDQTMTDADGTETTYKAVSTTVKVDLPYIEYPMSFAVNLYNYDSNGDRQPVYTDTVSLEQGDVVNNGFEYKIVKNVNVLKLYGVNSDDELIAGTNTKVRFQLVPQGETQYSSFGGVYSVTQSNNEVTAEKQELFSNNPYIEEENNAFDKTCNLTLSANLNDSIPGLTFKSITVSSANGNAITLQDDGLNSGTLKAHGYRTSEDYEDLWVATIVTENETGEGTEEITSKYSIEVKPSDNWPSDFTCTVP